VNGTNTSEPGGGGPTNTAPHNKKRTSQRNSWWRRKETLWAGQGTSQWCNGNGKTTPQPGKWRADHPEPRNLIINWEPPSATDSASQQGPLTTRNTNPHPKLKNKSTQNMGGGGGAISNASTRKGKSKKKNQPRSSHMPGR